jgi:hypothetical protein
MFKRGLFIKGFQLLWKEGKFYEWSFILPKLPTSPLEDSDIFCDQFLKSISSEKLSTQPLSETL